MSEEVEMTPITPEEIGAEPPKVSPAAATTVTSAPTVKLKPVIRKPMIRKPVIGGAKPVTLKPATGTPPAPAAVPEAAAPAAEAPKPAPAIKSVTGPIPAQAILHKTGIIAEGILTPAQAQAAKTKTSRISLESAIGVAPTMKSAAPMKTIKLRRPTDIPAAGGVTKAPAEAGGVATPEKAPESSESASAAAAAPAPAAPTAAAPAATAPADEVTTVVEGKKPAEKPTTVTQKKTLKLQRPGFKRPTVSGLRRPGETSAAASAATSSAAEGTAVSETTDPSAVADIPELKPIAPSATTSSEDESGTVAGAPAWLNVMTIVAGLAALIVLGFCTWTLFTEAVGPAAGPNDLATFHSDTDYRR